MHGHCRLVSCAWSLQTGLLCMVIADWSLVHGHCRLVSWAWSLQTGLLGMVIADWSLVHGHCRLVSCAWSLQTGFVVLDNDSYTVTVETPLYYGHH